MLLTFCDQVDEKQQNKKNSVRGDLIRLVFVEILPHVGREGYGRWGLYVKVAWSWTICDFFSYAMFWEFL